MKNSQFNRVLKCSAMAALSLFFVTAMAKSVSAEGTKDMDSGDTGYRPYTERNKAKTFGQERLSHMQVYLEKGETVYFGTSVANGTLYDIDTGKGYLFTNSEMGTSFSDAELKYLNSADVWVYKGTDNELNPNSLPYKNNQRNTDSFLIDLPSNATNTTPGYIYNGVQEDGGVDLTGTGTGYKVTSQNTLDTIGTIANGTKTNANTFTASSDGIYSVVFFSSSLTAENPKMMKLSDKTTPFAKTQKGSTIASWDISVYNQGKLQTGRVFTKTLFLNMGGNALNSAKVSTGSLYSNVYAVTDDGYQYKVDFNGMDPYGFVFFANSRGLLTKDSEGNTSSLYHGVRSDNNLLSDFVKNNIILNMIPTDTNLDKTYHLFYEKPSAEALDALNIKDPSSGVGSISEFKFTGTGNSNANQGYVGKGGKFTFTASSDISATSYELDLDFTSVGGGTVVLSNALQKGKNSISWDGKDANGAIVPAGTYNTVKASIVLKGGEVHFPLLDVEQNASGVKVTRLNGNQPDSTVYFNNSSSNAGTATGDWTVEKNWTAGSQANATTGVDSSNGAMVFTNTYTKNDGKQLRNPNGSTLQVIGDGDQCALDLWADYNRTASIANTQFTLVDASFTVTKTWNRTDGTITATSPATATMTLQEYSDTAKMYKTATTDVSGNPITSTVQVTDNYTWDHLDPIKTYKVVEKEIVGYTTDLETVSKTVDANGKTIFAQGITNTYHATTLKLTKIWNMNGAKDNLGNLLTEPAGVQWVEFTVYKDANKLETLGVYRLNKTNGWTATVSPVDSTSTYYVYETAVHTYTSMNNFAGANGPYQINGEGKASGDGKNGFRSVITNTYQNSEFMTVGIFKYWMDSDINSQYRPSSIKMGLYKDGALVTENALKQPIENPVTLSDGNGWYYLWPALVAKDASSAGYEVKETTMKGNALDGYTAEIAASTFLHNFGYIGLQNTYQTTTFTVNKVWENHGVFSNPSSVTVHLVQSTDGGNTWFDVDTDAQMKLSSSNNWKYQWTGLPTYVYTNSEPVQIQYKIIEDEVPDYTTSISSVTGDAESGYSQTVTNSSIYTTLKVTKLWNYGQQVEEDRPNATNIMLLRNGEEVCAGILSADNNWSGTFSEMPIYDDNGTPYTYTVEEMHVTEYTLSGGDVTGNANDGFAVEMTNTHDDPVVPTPTPTPDPGTENPDTGDTSQTGSWAVVFFAAMIAAASVLLYKKTRE